MADVYLVCEGPADGLDWRVLTAIVVQVLSAPVIVTPAGSGSSLGSVASWLEERSRQVRPDGSLGPPSDAAFCIQDRDYRPRADAEAVWSNLTTRRLMWRRHEIENYLLEPRVVLVALDSFRRTVSAPWVQQLPTDEQDVATLLADLAQPMLEDHAGRVLHWELRVVKGNAGSTDLRLPTPAPAPGSEYPGRDEWLQALLAEVARLQRDCLTVAHLAVLGANEIQARYDAILSDLQRPELIGSGDFLADMDGHQLLSALGRHLWRLGAINLSDEDLQDELVAALARVYQPGLYQPDEFAELATRLCA